MTYNFVIIVGKYHPEACLNLTKEKFFEELWRWPYVDELWDFIDLESPDKEYLEDYIYNTFIDENIFHKYEDDDANCYAFTVSDDGKTKTYNWDQSLVDFVYDKIKDHKMIKSWLITTEAPYAGTEQYYAAYAEENPLTNGKIDDWFWNNETMNLWDSYGFRWEDCFDEEYEEVKEDFESYDDFYDYKIQEWQVECSINCEECNEKDFANYVPGGIGELEIIYDERNDK